MSTAADATAEPPSDTASDGARRARHALWAAIGMVAVWGSNFSVQKAVFTALSPGGFLFARYLMMPTAAAALLIWRHGFGWPRVPRADLFALLKLGLAGHLLRHQTQMRKSGVQDRLRRLVCVTRPA